MDAGGLSRISSVAASSTIRPAYMTITRSAISAMAPMSWLMRMIAVPVFSCSSFSRSKTWACTVTSSAVVGSSAISTLGRQASAMAIMTRWRMPARHLVGKLADAPFGGGNMNRLQHFDGAVERVPAVKPLMQAHGLGDLVADGIDRIKGGHRLLEDHGDVLAADLPHPFLAGLQQVLPLSRTAPAPIRPGGTGTRRMIDSAVMLLPHPDSPTMPRVRPGWRDSATPSSTLAVPWRVRNSTSRSSTSSSGAAASTAQRSLRRGLKASFSPSPIRLTASTVRKIATPGMVTVQGASSR